MAYFDARHLPPPSNEYVAWIDVMGIQTAMSRSIQIAANFVFKLHIAALEAKTNGITLYPVMDGVYVTSQNKKEMESFLRSMFADLAKVFVKEGKERLLFLIRGAISFGEIYHGRNVGKGASATLGSNLDYQSHILLGEPMINSHLGERNAPPFGIFVHSSARGENSSVGPDGWWRWFEGVSTIDRESIGKKCSSYFNWCYECRDEIKYDLDRILVHKGLAELYFASRLVG